MTPAYSNGFTGRRYLWRASWTVQDVDPNSAEPAFCDGGACVFDSRIFYGNSSPVMCEFQEMNRNMSTKNAVISLRSNTGQISRHVLPYERLLKATVVHIDHKENNLYVRPDIFQEKASALDFRLRYISPEILEPLGSRNVKIGQVYVVFSSLTNLFARAVCGHVKYTHQNITRFQMYFIDDGRLEFIEQKDVFLLPFAFGTIPPVCVPLDLANCSKSLAFSTCVDHFRSLQYGSRIIFALKSRAQSSGNENARDNAYNENFPLAFTAQIFSDDNMQLEITCPKNEPENAPEAFTSYDSTYAQCSTFFTFPSFDSGKTFPSDSTARVVRRCDREGIYWMADECTISFIESVIVQPADFLCVGETIPASCPCIAYVKYGHEMTRSRYCRALTREFSADRRRCTIFLVDYGQIVTCDVFSLFTLEGQPQPIYETPMASFLCVVNNCDANGIVQITRTYLCEGVTYNITLLSTEDDGMFHASVFLPSMESIFNELKNKDLADGSSFGNVVQLVPSAGRSLEERLLGSGFWEDDESFDEDEFLKNLKATLLRIDEKVTRRYDELQRKLDLLQTQLRCEASNDYVAQRMQASYKRPRNFIPRQTAPFRVNKAVGTHQPEVGKMLSQTSSCSGALQLCSKKTQTGPDKNFGITCADLLWGDSERRRSVLRKNKGLANGLKVLTTNELRKTEGSCSSFDSGIEHSDEHSSPSPRVASPICKAATLKYKPLFGHITVPSGRQYCAKRSDDDYRCRLWPLFFIHVLCEENTRMLDENLNSLEASVHLQSSEVKVGAICIAYCIKYDAKFRAVITDVKYELVEVFYVDYGNYEWIKLSNLYSIEQQSYTIRTHPGMAVPCIFLSFEVGNGTLDEDSKSKEALVNELAGEGTLCLRFVAQRADGIYVVEKGDA